MSQDPHLHAVTFYDHDREVVDRIARFVAEGIHEDGRTVVVATPEHRTQLVQSLLAMGLDPDEPPVAGHLVLLDARTTLRTFMTPTGPDPDRFAAHVGRRVTDAGADGAPVRVFGEMVGLLWEAGDVQGAIALETMWNGMIEHLGFMLLCAYPASLIEAGHLIEVDAICGQHSSVQAPPQYAAGLGDHSRSSRVFLPVPEAVRSSRRFVVASLERLGVPDLVHDASLIVSELATNAVRHAQSPFRVSVDQSVDTVCISVQDVDEGQAEQHLGDGDEHALNGRGMTIINALARRWGCDSLHDGKVVWAELAVSPRRAPAPSSGAGEDLAVRLTGT